MNQIEPAMLAKLEGLDSVESLKQHLCAIWHNNNEWRLELGRLLIKLREQIQHGEWIKFYR